MVSECCFYFGKLTVFMLVKIDMQTVKFKSKAKVRISLVCSQFWLFAKAKKLQKTMYPRRDSNPQPNR